MNHIPIGAKFGRLTIISIESIPGNIPRVLCRCDCGKITVKRWCNVKNNLTKSCGCLFRETRKIGGTTHGLGKPPEFVVWTDMKARCNNPKEKSYERYGGRGIKVCGRWNKSFADFYYDMGPRPTPKHSIERIDNNGNYEPNNCKWIIRDRQARNRRNNTFITYQGVTLTIGEWNSALNFPVGTISQRIHKLGWSVDKACSTPPTHSK